MNKLKNILDDLKNRDEETLKLVADISDFIDSKKEVQELDNIDYIIKEELIHGYLVLYQYKIKKIMQKNRDGIATPQTLTIVRIISIVEPLSHKEVTDSNTENLIMNIIKNKIR